MGEKYGSVLIPAEISELLLFPVMLVTLVCQQLCFRLRIGLFIYSKCRMAYLVLCVA